MSHRIETLKKSSRWSSSELNIRKEKRTEDHRNHLPQRSVSTPDSSDVDYKKGFGRSVSKTNPMYKESVEVESRGRGRWSKNRKTSVKSRSSKIKTFLRKSLFRGKQQQQKEETKKRSIEQISQRKNAKIEKQGSEVSFYWSIPEDEVEEEEKETCFLEFPPDLFRKERSKSESSKTESACGKRSETSSFEWDMEGFEDFDEFNEDCDDEDDDSDFAEDIAFFARRESEDN